MQYLSAALAALTFAAYSNSLGNEFVFDDNALVLGNGRSLGLSNLLRLITSYRPVRNISYAIDLAIWGEKPFGFHLSNVLIHAGTAILVFLLVKRLANRVAPAFLAGLIFALHPIQTDAAAYVSGRRDVLFGLFYFAAFLCYLVYRHRNAAPGGTTAKFGGRVYLLLFLLFWVLSLASKEMAISLPLVILLWSFCEAWTEVAGSWMTRSTGALWKALRADLWLYATLGASGAAYAIYMVVVRKSSGRVTGLGVHFWGDSFWANLLTALRVQGWYLKQLVWPTPIAQYYGAFDISRSVADWRVLSSFAAVAALLAWALVLLRKNTLAAFAILSYFAMLLPVSQIIPHHELVADHYLYLPIASFGLAVSLLIERLSSRGLRYSRMAYAAAALLVIVFGLLTARRNQDWKSEFTAWQANYEAVPYSPRAAHNLGGLYLKSNPQRAEELFKQALASDPNFEPSYLALAKLYVTHKRIPEAEEMIERGMSLAEAQTGSYVIRNSALLRSQLTSVRAAAKWEVGERDETEKLLWTAVAAYPGNPEPYDSLANIYHGRDRGREIDVLRRAVASAPDFEVSARLASVLIEEKRYDEARSCLLKMLSATHSANDCRKSSAYLAGARGAIKGAMELREIGRMLDELLRDCGA